jgi:hypothetical protein
MVTRYSDEERQQIYAAAREAIEAADRTLAEPRHEYVPPVEGKLERWKREAAEQEQRFARERRAEQLTDYEVATLQRAELTRIVDQQKAFLLEVMAGAIAGMRDQIISHVDRKIAETFAEAQQLADELAGLRADAAIGKAFNKNGGEVIDLPNPFKKRVA